MQPSAQRGTVKGRRWSVILPGHGGTGKRGFKIQVPSYLQMTVYQWCICKAFAWNLKWYFPWKSHHQWSSDPLESPQEPLEAVTESNSTWEWLCARVCPLMSATFWSILCPLLSVCMCWPRACKEANTTQVLICVSWFLLESDEPRFWSSEISDVNTDCHFPLCLLSRMLQVVNNRGCRHTDPCHPIPHGTREQWGVPLVLPAAP